MRLIPKSWAAVTTAASTDESRPDIMGTHYVELPEGRVRLEATDGARAIRVEGKTIDAKEFPILPNSGLEPEQEELREVIIPSKALREAFKALPKQAVMPVLGLLAVSVPIGAEDSVVSAVLATTDLDSPKITRTRIISRSFPNLNAVIPQGKVAYQVDVNPRLLAETLKAVGDISHATESNRSVTLTFYVDGARRPGMASRKPFKIDARDPDNDTSVVAVVAPMNPTRVYEDEIAEEFHDARRLIEQPIGGEG